MPTKKKTNKKLKSKRVRKRMSKLSKFQDKVKKFVSSGTGRITFDINRSNPIMSVMLSNISNLVVGRHNYYLRGSGDNYYHLNPRTRERLLELIQNDFISTENTTESDEDIIQTIQELSEITIIRESKKTAKKIVKRSGALFMYFNKTNVDFSSLGIYKDKEEMFEKNEQCFLFALKQYNKMNNNEIPHYKIEEIKHSIRDAKLSMEELQIIVDKLGYTIKLSSWSEKAKRFLDEHKKGTILTRNVKGRKCIKMCLYKGHYFINKKVQTSSYYLKYYKELHNVKNGYKINKIQRKKSGNYYNYEGIMISSQRAVKFLIDKQDELLEPIPMCMETLSTVNHKKFKEITTLEYDENTCCKLISEESDEVVTRKSKKDKYVNIFFDFETYKSVEIINGKRKIVVKPYLVCAISDKGDRIVKYGLDCGKQLLDELPYENMRMIAHNSSFDARFLIKYFNKFIPLVKGKRFLNISSSYTDDKGVYKDLIIKDSYLLIVAPLRKFGKMFNLEQDKEVMPYNIYDEDKYRELGYYPFNKAVEVLKWELESKCLKEEEVEKIVKQFKDNVVKWKLMVDDEHFNHMKYSEIYCFMDCEVLREGYNKFRSLIIESLGLDVNNILTSASLSNQFLTNEGCYDDVYSLAGIPRKFIEQTIVGGRVCSNGNRKYHIKKVRKSKRMKKIKMNTTVIFDDLKIVDFDAVSLYPSAMIEMKGFLKGKPKVIEPNQLNMEFLSKQDGMFIQILVKKVKIKRGFTTLSYLANGKRNWKNDMEGRTYYVDKIMLEDAIEFHGIEFDIVKGYYYNEGFNTTVNDVMKHIFAERIKCKNEPVLDDNGVQVIKDGKPLTRKNPLEQIYKLIMNSGYGRTIMKEITTKTMIVDEKDRENFQHRNFNEVSGQVTKIEGTTKWIFKLNKSVESHFNTAQVGSEILSMSKRIMNRVMCLAEDNGLDIYFTDTDSIHMKEGNIKILQKLFKEKYNQELMGEQTGQFNSDFDLDDCEDVYSKEVIFLGKKCYCDALVGINKKTGEIVEDYHFRMKGIPQDVIKYECKKRKITIMQLYKYLLDGKECKCDKPKECYENLNCNHLVKFDLTNEGRKINFVFNPNFTITNNDLFVRSVKFL